jgi:hypothetical protein
MGKRAEPAVEQWGTYEVALRGPDDGNPFVDVHISLTFSHGHRQVTVDGFYDGDGTYLARYMPDTLGPWHYASHSNADALDGASGTFLCTEPSDGNHGPVRVASTFHFAHADGTPHRSFGTTCYAWAHQGDEMEELTLETLRNAPFNKMRMCIFPKHYEFNRNEPVYYPFERREGGGWDFTRFSPAFFRHFERRVGQLRDLGIEADLILFHPYDRWGFADMGAEADDRYIRYVVARLSSFRNVWWSLANEYDLMGSKKTADWDRFFRIIQECDSAQHLRSIHNCHTFYDHARPWVTHQSIQRHNLEDTGHWRELYRKPVVVDECAYEGNINRGWGNIPAWELVRRFWEGVARGGYVGHGETYMHPEDILWWSKGGVLHGESPARIRFLRAILEDAPAEGLDEMSDYDMACAGKEGEYYLMYFGFRQPKFRRLQLPADLDFQIDVIDTWEMTVDPIDGVFSGKAEIGLPGKPYIALRVTRVG